MSASPEQAVQLPARPGQQGQARPGLRERKKARTRAAIREHAFRLFRAQGYDATTVEQIADAAEVSPSTFFRYFPTKEDVVVEDPTPFGTVVRDAAARRPGTERIRKFTSCGETSGNSRSMTVTAGKSTR